MNKGCLALLLSLSAGAALAPGQTPPAPAALPAAPVPVAAPASAAPAPPAPATPGLVPASYPSPPVTPPPPLDVPPAPPGSLPVIEGGPGVVPPFGCCDAPCLWLQMDFLLWRIKHGPLPVPLVTTGSPSDANPGALGQPHTQVLFGGSGLDYGTFAGGRLQLGFWLDAESRFGVDFGGFALGQQRTTFSAFSDAAGNPVLSVPIFNAQTQKEDQVPVAAPGAFAGGVVVSSTSELWGTDVNGDVNVYRGPHFQADLLAGFRYLNLRERLGLQTPDVTLPSATGQGGGTEFNTVDDFRTENQFFGGQLGGRIGYCWQRWTVDLTGTVALGSTYQTIDINGFGVATGSNGVPQSVPGGIFAQPTNMYRYWAWDFTVTTQAELKVGFQVCRNVQLTAGYDFLYWSSVARPGEQINREVNLSQSPLLGGGTPSGPAQPVAPLSRTDFFAHGLSLGLDLRW